MSSSAVLYGIFCQEGIRLKFSELKTLDGWLLLIKLLKPKFYNRLTWFVVVAGASILSTSLVEAFISAILGKTFDIPILDGNESIVGLILISVALSYNLACQFMESNSQFRSNLQLAERDNNHDREMFFRLDAKLEESKLKEALSWIDTHEFYSTEIWDELYEFVYEGKKASNKMINQEVEEVREALIISIDSLLSFMARNFFNRSGRQSYEDSNHYLYPDLNPDLDGGFEPDKMQFYGRKSDELSSLIIESSNAYDTYRRMVKVHLHC